MSEEGIHHTQLEIHPDEHPLPNEDPNSNSNPTLNQHTNSNQKQGSDQTPSSLGKKSWERFGEEMEEFGNAKAGTTADTKDKDKDKVQDNHKDKHDVDIESQIVATSRPPGPATPSLSSNPANQAGVLSSLVASCMPVIFAFPASSAAATNNARMSPSRSLSTSDTKLLQNLTKLHSRVPITTDLSKIYSRLSLLSVYNAAHSFLSLTPSVPSSNWLPQLPRVTEDLNLNEFAAEKTKALKMLKLNGQGALALGYNPYTDDLLAMTQTTLEAYQCRSGKKVLERRLPERYENPVKTFENVSPLNLNAMPATLNLASPTVPQLVKAIWAVYLPEPCEFLVGHEDYTLLCYSTESGFMGDVTRITEPKVLVDYREPNLSVPTGDLNQNSILSRNSDTNYSPIFRKPFLPVFGLMEGAESSSSIVLALKDHSVQVLNLAEDMPFGQVTYEWKKTPVWEWNRMLETSSFASSSTLTKSTEITCILVVKSYRKMTQETQQLIHRVYAGYTDGSIVELTFADHQSIDVPRVAPSPMAVHVAPVIGMVSLANGALIVSVGQDNVLSVIDSFRGNCLARKRVDFRVSKLQTIEYSPKTELMRESSANVLADQPSSLSEISASEHTVILAGVDGEVEIWRIIPFRRDRAEVHVICQLSGKHQRKAAVVDVLYVHSKRVLASITSDGYIRRWWFSKQDAHMLSYVACRLSVPITSDTLRILLGDEITDSDQFGEALDSTLAMSSEIVKPKAETRIGMFRHVIEMQQFLAEALRNRTSLSDLERDSLMKEFEAAQLEAQTAVTHADTALDQTYDKVLAKYQDVLETTKPIEGRCCSCRTSTNDHSTSSCAYQLHEQDLIQSGKRSAAFEIYYAHVKHAEIVQETIIRLVLRFQGVLELVVGTATSRKTPSTEFENAANPFERSLDDLLLRLKISTRSILESDEKSGENPGLLEIGIQEQNVHADSSAMTPSLISF
eukprot:CAMPEP_0184694794 /NCGR_PEP_ID=MMETSP0313-20130426/2643_1 /TAXON_ID=2792 /ORGANISM="Porphyridium aerugineum, Strain SAG 1380-2" /LENGTH=963 /DNA_ID=CAMNT_0027153145 /DNA_START=101 /DNA_END=2992 /DNA_ORIENTATION=+